MAILKPYLLESLNGNKKPGFSWRIASGPRVLYRHMSCSNPWLPNSQLVNDLDWGEPMRLLWSWKCQPLTAWNQTKMEPNPISHLENNVRTWALWWLCGVKWLAMAGPKNSIWLLSTRGLEKYWYTKWISTWKLRVFLETRTVSLVCFLSPLHWCIHDLMNLYMLFSVL